jgi:hypothetical protein
MSRSKRILLIVFAVVIVLSMGGALWYKYVYQGNSEDTDPEHQLPAIKITLINGCGFEGLAKEFSDFLADKNVDIVSMGNTRKPIYDKTIIVIRKGGEEDLKRLERMTGISRFTEVRSETALADFDIIIGKDYEQYTK